MYRLLDSKDQHKNVALAILADIWGPYIMACKMGAITKIEMSGKRAVYISSGHEIEGFFVDREYDTYLKPRRFDSGVDLYCAS